jgi:D-3-phosphoglycerate dehydrogenase / 2-oxoglutarate reductase
LALALSSTPLAGELLISLTQRRAWDVRQVGSVASAVSAMSDAERGEVRALVVETEPVDRGLIGRLVNLEVVICPRSEPVNVDVLAAEAHGVAVIHAPGRNAEAVADFTLGLCLAALRHIATSYHAIVSGELTSISSGPSPAISRDDVIWRPREPGRLIPYLAYKGPELSGLTVGIVGYGAVGQAVARRFRGLVRQVIIVDPLATALTGPRDGLESMSLDDMLPQADVVTLHARSKDTIIGRDELFKMKTGSYLINTARATVLDYDALVQALDSGPLRGAALDVFPEEPLPHASPLRTHAGLTLTPHLAGASEQVGERQYAIAATGLDGIYAPDAAWERLPVRNPQVRESWARRLETQNPSTTGSQRS